MADDLNIKAGVESSDVQSGLSSVVSTLKNSVNAMVAKLGELGTSSQSLSSKIQASNTAIAASYKSMATQVGIAHTQVTGFFSKMQSAVNALTAIIAGGMIAHFVIELGKASADYAEEITRAGEKTGIALGKLQELKAVAKLNEVEFRALQLGLQRLALQMTQAQQGSARAVDNFKRLGISVAELKGMKMDEVLERMADKFNASADGGTKLALAQQMLGRAGREFVPLLNQGSEGLREQIKVVRELGIVMDDQALMKAKKLKEELKLLNLVNEALTREISSALTPAFTQIAGAMIKSRTEGGALKEMVDGLSRFLVGLVNVASYVAESIEGIGHALGGVAAITASVLTGNFARAGRIMEDFLSDTTVTAKWNKFRKDLETPINIPPIKVKPDIETGTGGKHTKDTRMAEWREELQEKQAALGPFREMEKADEIAFWESKLSLIKGMGEKEVALRRQVMQIIRNDKKSAAREEQALDVKKIEDQISAARFNLAEQIKLTHTLAEFQKATWGENSKQYEAALAKETALKEKQIEQLAKLEKMRTDLHLKADLQEVAIDEEMVHRAVELRQMSTGQQLAVEAQFENRRYVLVTAALAKERAAIQADELLGDAEKEERMLALDEKLEAVESQHQAKLTQIVTAAEKERQQVAIDAANAVQNTFATVLEDLANRTKTYKQIALDAIKSITTELNRLAANEVAKNLLGAGTSGGNFLTGIFGKIFGTGGGATGAATADAAMTTLGTTVTATVDPALLALTAAADKAAASLMMVGSSGGGGGLGGLGGGFDWEGMMGSFASGTPYVPRDMLAYVHKGEAVVPAAINRTGAMGSHVSVSNIFQFAGPVDTRTQTQMALAAYHATDRAAKRH